MNLTYCKIFSISTKFRAATCFSVSGYFYEFEIKIKRNERIFPFLGYFYDFETTKNRTMSLFLS